MSCCCNFRFPSGISIGTQKFITGFHGLSCMPKAYQNVNNHSLIDFKNIHCFLYDIITVSRGPGIEHTKVGIQM